MAILKIQGFSIGRASVDPELISINTDDTNATVTTAGYLSTYGAFSGVQFKNSQLALVYTTDMQTNMYKVSVSNDGIASLTATVEGGVLFPVTNGNFAIFNGDSGEIKDLGFSPTNPSYSKVVMQETGLTTVGNVPMYKDTAGSLENSALQADRILNCLIDNPNLNINTISFDINVTAANLASGGFKFLFGSSFGKTFKIRSLYLARGSVNFGGVGGNRSIAITDDTTVYSVVTGTTLSMSTTTNAVWGDSLLPLPTSAALNTSTQSGAALKATYTGGTTDYTTGDINIAGIAQRIT